MSDEQPSDSNQKKSYAAALKRWQRLSRPLKTSILSLAGALLLGIGLVGYVYAVSPSVVREPKLEHYHFRMQVLINGKAEDFGTQKYQTGYAKDQCNANLPEQPIHFHDNKDQFTHIHWEGMTGGMVMKYYGWNMIGGLDNALGYKLDDLQDIQKVTTHGDYLPAIPKDAKLYIYSGNEKGYKERSLEDWKTQDLEKFFQTTSNSPAHELNQQKTSLMDMITPTAAAHGTEDHSAPTASTSPSTIETAEDELTRINNLIGNIVIFAQEDKPTDSQIKERFNNLEPLTDSTCGG